MRFIDFHRILYTVEHMPFKHGVQGSNPCRHTIYIFNNYIMTAIDKLYLNHFKRHFIGFELNKEYFEKACERIQTENKRVRLF